MTEWTNSLLTGDVRERLDDLPDDSVHMAMTSPPYFGLRDYGDETNEVWGGDDDCDHEWTDAGTVKRGGQNTDDNPPDVGGNAHAQDTGIRGDGVSSDECRKCGAWRGQLGLEPKLDRFIDNLVDVFREVRRVLRPDGSAWLNLGDSYAQTGSGQPTGSYKESTDAPEPRGDSFGRKNKMLVPHRVAIALQSDGWVVRNDVTWVKPNPMPSSVKDRLNTTTEQIFHLTPNPDYWYDLDAIREDYAESGLQRGAYSNYSTKNRWTEKESVGNDQMEMATEPNPAGKNPGDVFEVTTKPFADAHFAVYPPELCEKPLKATCPPTVCAECGSPYEREVERTTFDAEHGVCDEQATVDSETVAQEHADRPTNYGSTEGKNLGGRQYRKWKANNPDEFKGWTPTCDCDTDATEPGIALDPFAGAGTTLLKAKELGRRFVGVELNAEYADMARARIGLTPNDPANVRSDDAQQGFEAYTDGGDDAE